MLLGGNIANLFLFICFLGLFDTSSAVNILAIFPMPSLSHQFLGYKLIGALHKRQHNITFVTAYPNKIPKQDLPGMQIISVEDNVNLLYGTTNSSPTIDPEVKDKDRNNPKKSFFHRQKHSAYEAIIYLHRLSYIVAESTLSNKNVQQLLKSEATFDLVLMEYFLNEAYFGLGSYFKAPVVLLSTLPTSTFNNYLVANPAFPSYVPHILSPFSPDMNWWERLQNIMINMFDIAFKRLFMLPKHRRLLKRYISQDLTLDDALYNVSLMLVNSHPSVNTAVPHAKNVIEIGGFHIKGADDSNISSLNKSFAEKDKGVILFSMGSNLNSADMPQEKIDAFVKAFAKFQYKFIWKWEQDPPKMRTENIEFVEWFPQQEYLALRNVKAFITHGGLLSMLESVYHGVPLIGIPIYGDQMMNIATAVHDGYALMLPYNDISEETVTTALKEILNNDTYTVNAKLRSKIMRDRPQDPLESAVYWVEYVIRNNGAHHLKSPGLKLEWYKKYMIETIIILTFIIQILFFFYIIMKRIINSTWVSRKSTRYHPKKKI